MTAPGPIRDLAASAAAVRARAADAAVTEARIALLALSPLTTPAHEWYAAQERIRVAESEGLLALAGLLSEIDYRAGEQ